MEFETVFDTSVAEEAFKSLGDMLGGGTNNPDILQGMTTAANYADGFNRGEFLSASHGGGLWEDIAFRTKYERARKATGGFKRTKGISRRSRVPVAPFAFPVLYISGTLYTSLTQGEDGHWWLVTETADQSSVQSGTDVYYADPSHWGNAEQNRPPRPIIQYPNADAQEKMVASIHGGIESAINGVISLYTEMSGFSAAPF